ncbi:hypothetical protein BDZ45DRAFT_767959, partial [Acephala macrosclerotiorum]
VPALRLVTIRNQATYLACAHSGRKKKRANASTSSGPSKKQKTNAKTAKLSSDAEEEEDDSTPPQQSRRPIAYYKNEKDGNGTKLYDHTDQYVPRILGIKVTIAGLWKKSIGKRVNVAMLLAKTINDARCARYALAILRSMDDTRKNQKRMNTLDQVLSVWPLDEMHELYNAYLAIEEEPVGDGDKEASLASSKTIDEILMPAANFSDGASQ